VVPVRNVRKPAQTAMRREKRNMTSSQGIHASFVVLGGAGLFGAVMAASPSRW
jgi:hypothetical protein